MSDDFEGNVEEAVANLRAAVEDAEAHLDEIGPAGRELVAGLRAALDRYDSEADPSDS